MSSSTFEMVIRCGQVPTMTSRTTLASSQAMASKTTNCETPVVPAKSTERTAAMEYTKVPEKTPRAWPRSFRRENS